MQSAQAPFITLAQDAQPGSAKPHSNTGGVFLWVAILIAVILVGFVLLMWLKRRIFSADSAAEESGGLMDSLRHMRDTGQMSKEEYEATRKAMIARMAQSDLGVRKDASNGDLKSR